MRLELGTPGLLFGAISLLLLGYTSRFLAIAALIRALHERYEGRRDPLVRAQIDQLRRRLRLIQSMQSFGLVAFLLCLGVLGALLVEAPPVVARGLFGATIGLLAVSLVLALVEIRLSAGALNLQLADLEDDGPPRYPHVTPDVPRVL